MIPTRTLAQTAREALEILRAQDDVIEAEVFVAANTSLVARIHFTSHIPCNGVEEPKSHESIGVGIQAVLRSADGTRIGFGSEPNDFTPDGIRRALAKARQAAVLDPEFVSLPRPTGNAAACDGITIRLSCACRTRGWSRQAGR